MKKLILSLVFVAFAFSMSAQSNVVKTNPLALAFGNFNATYERVLGTSSSVLISGQYMYKLLGIDVSLAGFGIGYRYYFTHINKPVPGGFYINPLAKMSFGSATNDDGDTYDAKSVGVGVELGYQWVWTSGFVLDLGIGPMYSKVKGANDSEGFTGTLPSATLAIGYAF